MKRLLALYAAIALALGASAAGIRLPDQGGGGVPEVLGGGSLHVTIQGEGDPLGTELGNIAVDSSDRATSAVSGWTANADGYSDDGNGNKLLGPLEPETTQTGYWVLTKDGTSTKIVRRLFIPYGDFGQYIVDLSEDNSHSRQFTLKYDGDDSGQPPFFEITPVTGKLALDGSLVYLHRGNASPDVGVQQAEVDTLKADFSRLQSEYARIAARPSGTAVITTQIDRFALVNGNRLRLQWTRNGVQQTDDVPLPQHQVAFHEFELVADATALAAANTNDTLLVTADFGTYTAGDVLTHNGTAWVVALNLIPALDAGSVGTTQLADGSVTQTKLSTRLLGILNGKLDTTAASAAVRSLVWDWAEADDNSRIPESKLPVKVDDFADALSGVAGWQDEGAVPAADAWISSHYAQTQTPANVENFPFAYVQSYLSTPRHENVYVIVRVPRAVDETDLRLAIGTFANYLYSTSTWHLVDTSGGYRYYSVFAADIPVGATVRAQFYEPFTLDGERVGIEPWATIGNTQQLPESKIPSSTGNVPATGLGALVRRMAGAVPAFTKINRTDFDSGTQGVWDALPKTVVSEADIEAGAANAQRFNASRVWTISTVFHAIKQFITRPTADDDGKVLTARSGSAAWETPQSLPLVTLIDGSGTGLSVLNSSNDRQGNLTLFDPSGDASTFDLDLNEHGVIDVAATFTLNTRSSNSLGFDQTLSPSVTARISNVLFARDFDGAGALYDNNAVQGVKVGEAVVSLGTTTLGTVQLWLAKNASNELGYYIAYDGTASNQTWAIAITIRAAFFHNDSTAASASGLDQTAVDARVVAGTLAPARAGNTDRWSPNKVPSLTALGGLTEAQVDARIRALVRDFELSAQPSSAVNFTTGSTAATWTPWTSIVSVGPISASQAGRVLLLVHVHAMVTSPATTGGGDRIVVNVRLVRTRSSVDAVLLEEMIYGPRNVPQVASRDMDDVHAWKDVAVAGDHYKVESRVQSQMTARTVQFATATNQLTVMPVGR